MSTFTLEPCDKPAEPLRGAPRKQVRCDEGYVVDFFTNRQGAYVRYYNHEKNDTFWMRIERVLKQPVSGLTKETDHE